ncbi:MAG: DUF4129 domain-containing protein [Silicimonas sp.]|nr:DUF4129 domain-containing protein [Silicimonas sp.]
MVRFFRLSLLAALALAAPSAPAQDAVAARAEIGASGEAYLRSLRLRRIESDVAYFDPSAPPPSLDTQQEPEPEPEAERSGGAVRTGPLPTLIAAVLLITMAYLLYRYGGGLSVSLRGEAENARRQRADGRARFDGGAGVLPLATILNESNRRLALVHLAQRALDAAVTANGMLFQPSWTARETLRRLRGSDGDLAALRALVLASERVQFGGRDISEADFQSHLQAVRPLIEGQGA